MSGFLPPPQSFLSHSFQEVLVTQGGAAAPLCPRGVLRGTCAQLSPGTQNGEEKGETEDGTPLRGNLGKEGTVGRG